MITFTFALTIALGGGVAAQDATPSTMAGHPLVGSWAIDTDTEDPANPVALGIFSSDGTYLEVEVDGFIGVGGWEPTGESSANMTFWFVTPDGSGTVRASIDVAPEGGTFTATYTVEFVSPDGTSTGEIGPGTAEGTKLSVEPQGTPVGSFEEVFGTPEAATPEG
jgi:hypothetical protein